MMDALVISILAGTGGGLVRALVGIAKYFERNKTSGKMHWWYIFFSLFVAAVVGAAAGAVLNGDWQMAIVAGYAGTDFLEGLYKMRKQQGMEI